MNNIRIGEKIAAKRREKGVTQEELASFLGVSKPAVSKWESDQSYPDITLLPQLATFFNMTVDELLSYEPQMSKEDVRKMYAELCKAFASEPFETAYEKCREYAKKYYSCWSVQFNIGVLYVNHAGLSGEKALDIIGEAVKLFERTAKESNDDFARQAVSMQGFCYLMLNRPVDTIDLLSDADEPVMSNKMLLVKAYQMKGDVIKAKTMLQGYLYLQLIGIVGALPDFMGLYLDDPAKAKEGLRKVTDMSKVFDLEAMHPAVFLSAYIAAAQVFVMQGDNEEAFNMLEKYVHILVRPGLFPLKLHGNSFFDSLDSFIDTLDLGTYPPRSDEVIKQSAKDAVLLNPGFEPLKNDPRFAELAGKLNKV